MFEEGRGGTGVCDSREGSGRYCSPADAAILSLRALL